MGKRGFDRGGQAAIEYLVTYGWTFFVVLGVLSVMWSYGLFDFNNKAPDICNFGGHFPCYPTGVKIATISPLSYADHYVMFRIMNNREHQIAVYNFTADEPTNTQYTCHNFALSDIDGDGSFEGLVGQTKNDYIVIDPYEWFTIKVYCKELTTVEGNRAVVNVNFNYAQYKSSVLSPISRSAKGRIGTARMGVGLSV